MTAAQNEKRPAFPFRVLTSLLTSEPSKSDRSHGRDDIASRRLNQWSRMTSKQKLADMEKEDGRRKGLK
jgi:hypothetical protein